MKLLVSIFLIFSNTVFSSENVELSKAPIDLTDNQSLQRGAKTFINYCLNCHSANFMRYSNLQDIGLSSETIKNDLLFTGDKIGDTMAVNMSVKDSKGWFGVSPPDLSVVARSRGADWIYSYMRGFYRDPTRDMGWNNVVLANSAMPHILWELQGEQVLNPKTNKLEKFTSGKLNTKEYDSLVADLTNYLVYMSEPDQLKRKKLGYYVIGFLIFLLLLVINLKKEYWRDIK
ncbi:MAG: cytochrome c1 [Nitrosomonadales bacterium]|mgnify:CR=1 FL=1|jgi:ubiquinol-cytochrome c reductase cytochrome c1 subunit|nr:cytochrome c1 [Nitrosomonadales bacterium]MBT3918233.1 cytochrome c1 [Nitrosomonadales bacterium]MBT4182685.1 cytochrome c1 [Nitrosomonadales bacterium]MBT4571545.1 cytochrome c1 [Nitrosomonadales bacterium]MBT4759605.1 cytochrome c1 [Nitrosomonadales bacterium]